MTLWCSTKPPFLR
ncbi:hypothetical protein LINPERPRIM_LOCUS1573 [Linum perenne]